MRSTGQQGFTLLEVAIALLVLAVGLCSILAVFPVAISWATETRNDSTGLLAARSMANEIAMDTAIDKATISDGDNYPTSLTSDEYEYSGYWCYATFDAPGNYDPGGTDYNPQSDCSDLWDLVIEVYPTKKARENGAGESGYANKKAKGLIMVVRKRIEKQ